MKTSWMIVSLLSVFVLAVVASTWSLHAEPTSVASVPAKLAAKIPRPSDKNGYVTSETCKSCHANEHATWHASYHRTMTRPATPENVLGRFDGTEIDSRGLKYRVFREGDEFWVEMPDPEIMMYTVQGGARIEPSVYLVKRSAESPVERLDLRAIPRVKRHVIMTTGSHHYQTYWVEGDAKFGRLIQTLPLVYLIKDDRWIPRQDAFMVPPDSPPFITQWNHHCIRCHSTGGNPNLVASDGGKPTAADHIFETEAAELGIACEACHGPGEKHVQMQLDLKNGVTETSSELDLQIVNPAKLDHRRSSQVCGQCHGVFVMNDDEARRYASHGSSFRPGDDLEATRYYIRYPNENSPPERKADLQRNQTFFRERWWDDGTILAGGREYTAILEAKCFQDGTMSCLSCHQMHGPDPVDQLQPDMRTNLACTQCHDQPQYTSQVSSHTHHAEASSGSECLNCHMPYTSYGLLGGIRSHQIAIPNIGASRTHGTPNACNLCHLDKTLDWTQRALTEWYQVEPQSLSPDQKSISAALLWALQGHAAQRIIVAWHMGWEPAKEASGEAWIPMFLQQLLSDPYGIVRYVAFDSLRKSSGNEQLEFDFLTQPADNQSQLQAIRTKVQQDGDGQVELLPPLLGDQRGRLDQAKFDEMLLFRDDRPVTIKE